MYCKLSMMASMMIIMVANLLSKWRQSAANASEERWITGEEMVHQKLIHKMKSLASNGSKEGLTTKERITIHARSADQTLCTVTQPIQQQISIRCQEWMPMVIESIWSCMRKTSFYCSLELHAIY